MAVLYRKYRPQNFSQVVGQKPIIQTLKNQVARAAVAHAYLFIGSRGVGKTSVARILAKAVNCISLSEYNALHPNTPKGDACGECVVCKQIEAGNFMDLTEIDAASNTGVDNIRELIEHVRFSPSSAKYKVFIIDEIHMLSKGAFNALLKTLEEPPQHAIFILATTEINKVPATIISRTQRFDFKALPVSDILGHLKHVAELEKIEVDEKILELVAQNAEGGLRDALSLLDKVLTLGEAATLNEAQELLGITDIATCKELLSLIADGKVKDIPEFYTSLSSRGLDYAIFNRDFLEFLRQVLIYKTTETLGGQNQESISDLSGKFSANDLIFITRLFLKSYKDMADSPSPEIPLLLAALEAGFRKAENGNMAAMPNKAVQSRVSSPIVTSVKQDLSEPEPKKNSIENKELETVEDLATEVSLTEVEQFWPKVIEKIKVINSPLASLVRTSPLEGVSAGRVILRVKFKFDKQNMENPKNLSLICQAIEQASGKKLGISARVSKPEAEPLISSSQSLTDALKIFGGELIE